MKAQRRHELEQNKLAQWLAQVVVRVRPHLTKIILAVTALLAAFLIVSVWRSLASQGRTAAWDALFTVERGGTLADLENLAEENPGSVSGQWAALMVAERRSDDGCELLFSNKENAAEELQKAVAVYSQLLDKNRDVIEGLRERALIGRAKAYEALAGAYPGNRDDLEKAVADYQEVASRYADGPYAASANRQVAFLNSPEGRRFYEKYAAYKPKPPASRTPAALGSPDDFTKRATTKEGDSSKGPSFEDVLKGAAAFPEKPGAGPAAPAKGPATTESPKAAPTTPETPKADSPKPAPTTPETPKAEPPKPAPTPTEPPKPEPAKTEPAKPEPAKPDPAKKG